MNTSSLLFFPVNLSVLGFFYFMWVVTQDLSFCVCLISCSIMFSKFFHVVAFIKAGFFFMAEWYFSIYLSSMWMYISSSFSRGHFSWVYLGFYLLIINISVYLCICFCVTVFSFLWSVDLRMELLGHVLTFKGTSRLFQSSCAILYSLQQCMRVPVSSHSWQYLLSVLFFCG